MGMFARISMPSNRSAAALSVRTIPETVSENRSHAPSDDELLAGVTSNRVFTGFLRAAKSSDTMRIACSPSVRTFTSVPARLASVNHRMSEMHRRDVRLPCHVDHHGMPIPDTNHKG